MREIILKRIEEIRKANENFSRSLIRWRIPLSHGSVVKYADEINFAELTDVDLVFLFERLINRINKQM